VVHSYSLSEKSLTKLWATIRPTVLSHGHLDVVYTSSCDWFHSKAVQRLIELHFSFPKLCLLFLYLIAKKSYLNLKWWYIRILFLRKAFPNFGLLFVQLFLATAYSSCDWFNSKAVQRLIHKETGTADSSLSGDTNIIGVRVW